MWKPLFYLDWLAGTLSIFSTFLSWYLIYLRIDLAGTLLLTYPLHLITRYTALLLLSLLFVIIATYCLCYLLSSTVTTWIPGLLATTWIRIKHGEEGNL